MRFRDSNWMDIERYLQQDRRIILVLGSTHQQAYLSLTTSTMIPEKIGDAVAEREKVLMAPVLNFGVSERFVEFPGTISLGPETFAIIVSEIVESLMHQGFTRFFILNGHDRNILPPRIHDLHMEGLLQVDWYDWWRGEAAQTFEQTHNLHIDHANWGMNFPFTRISQPPKDEKPYVNLDYLEDGQPIRDVLGDGSFGGPYQIDDKLMFALFDSLVEEVAARVRALKA